ncbi:MAG: nucleotidyl transferase AbiEii/AbiGii toxin family protein [Pyrinomonadaceae bacterium]
MSEALPLAAVQEAVLEFLRDREDAVVFGAQAVNAYVDDARMTQDIDLLSTHAGELAQELRDHLSQRFHIAVRIREVGEDRGYRLFQVRRAGNRHLVDLRSVESLPAARRIAGVLVIEPAELIAAKVIAFHQRRGQPKSGTDWRDLAMLLLKFPEMKSEAGPVGDILRAANATPAALAVWEELVKSEIVAADEDDEF